MKFNVQNGLSKNNKGILVLNNVLPEDVARAMIDGGRQKEPFYLLDLDEAYSRIQHFKRMMPRVQIFYAMKANDYEALLKLAISQGLGFDCASPGEIYKIRQLDVDPLSIIYAVPMKTPEQMIYARESGVRYTTFDTSYELKNTKQYWPDARLLIRIRVESDSLYQLGNKFGCNFDTEAIELLDEAAALGLKVVGVAFHVGSACFSFDSYRVGLQRVRDLFDHEAKSGRAMSIIDIGGGFLSDKIDKIDETAKLINRALEELFPDPSIQVIAEPGRYICDSSATLYTNINSVRKDTVNEKPINKIYISDGIFGTLRSSEPWHTIQMFTRKGSFVKNEDQQLEDAIIYGPTGDSDDRVMIKHTIRLPPCTPSDWLVLRIQGAYTFTFCSKFCCLEMPMIREVVTQDLWYKIKDNPVYSDNDFIVNPDISEPLPTTLPPLLAKDKINKHFFTPILTA